MSYMRFNEPRIYAKGFSSIYVFKNATAEKVVICKSLKEGIEISKENMFELIMSILSSANIELTKEQIRKLANELRVEIRDKPLSSDEYWELYQQKEREVEEIFDKRLEQFGRECEQRKMYKNCPYFRCPFYPCWEDTEGGD